MSKTVAYVRVSSKEQNLERQLAVLKTLGIEDELKRQGIKEGDYVKILNWTFEWYA